MVGRGGSTGGRGNNFWPAKDWGARKYGGTRGKEMVINRESKYLRGKRGSSDYSGVLVGRGERELGASRNLNPSRETRRRKITTQRILRVGQKNRGGKKRRLYSTERGQPSKKKIKQI